MKILLTGASSFTGYWFAKALYSNGHHVVSTLQNKLNHYSLGMRYERVKRLKQFSEIIDDCKFGEAKFIELISSEKFDVLCHHAAHVKDYRSLDFDLSKAVQENTNNLNIIINRMLKQGLKAIILTGSIFEPNEGVGSMPLIAFSPYGLSKGITSSIFELYCNNNHIPLGKFVIPNPFGPFEEQRFCYYLIKTWKDNHTATVNTPLYVRDNIHVEYLSLAYAKFVEQIINSGSSLKINPSGYIGTQGNFALKFASEMQSRLPLSCKVELNNTPTIFNEPYIRINTDCVVNYVKPLNDSLLWEDLASYYKEFYL